RQKAKQRPPLRRGANIEFPEARSLPAFLLVKAKLAGRVDKLFSGQDMDLSGQLGGVTSNPPLYGKPAVLSLSGRAAGGVAMALEGRLDQTREPGATELKLSYAGFPLAGLALGDPELGADVKDGRGRLNGAVRIVGDQWNG